MRRCVKFGSTLRCSIFTAHCAENQLDISPWKASPSRRARTSVCCGISHDPLSFHDAGSAKVPTLVKDAILPAVMVGRNGIAVQNPSLQCVVFALNDPGGLKERALPRFFPHRCRQPCLLVSSGPAVSLHDPTQGATGRTSNTTLDAMRRETMGSRR